MYYETEQKRESYKRMLRSLKHNQKELFENTEDGLKQYREFERDTLKTFRESALYKKCMAKPRFVQRSIRARWVRNICK